MSANFKQFDFKNPDAQSSQGKLGRVDPPLLDDETRTPEQNRKTRLFILLMLLIISQIIILASNNGFIDRAPESISVIEPASSLNKLDEVKAELNKVIDELDEINEHTKLKENPIVIEKTAVKPVLVAPVVLKPKTVEVKPAPKKALVITKAAPVILPAIVQVEVPEEVQIIAKEIKPAYIKYSITGETVESKAEQWNCVYDTKNGLMWEVKSKSDKLRNSENLYSWFNPEFSTVKGVSDGGRCKGDINCDTNSYIEEMNQQKYCGHNDWRLPTREEMLGLINYGNGTNETKINTEYFPETLPSWYWTSSSNESHPEFAWYVLFKNGMPLNDLKENPKHIRLVRSESSS